MISCEPVRYRGRVNRQPGGEEGKSSGTNWNSIANLFRQAWSSRLVRSDWISACPGSVSRGLETTRNPSTRISAARAYATDEPASMLPPTNSSNRWGVVIFQRVTDTTGLLPIVSKLEVRAGDPRPRRLPKCPARNMPQKILIVRHFIHGSIPRLGSEQVPQFLEQPRMKRSGGEFARFDLPRCLIKVEEADGSVGAYLEFVLRGPVFPLDENSSGAGGADMEHARSRPGSVQHGRKQAHKLLSEIDGGC